MVLTIIIFFVSENLVVFVTLRTDFNALRWPLKWGATFRSHSMRCGAVQTRGNFPLPFNVLRRRSNKGQLSVAMQLPSSKGQFSFESEVVHLESGFYARWAVAVCKNSFWEFLLRLTEFSRKIISSFPKLDHFLDPKRNIFSAHNLTCMISNQKIEQAC